MKVAGTHQLTHSSEVVWRALEDEAALTAAIPGLRRLQRTGADEYAISVDTGVGSVTGTFEGSFALRDKQAPQSCTVHASASGRSGSVTVVAQMRMRDDEREDAVLEYEADATVTGPLAGVGQRLVAAAARRTTERFLQALDDHLAAPVAAAEHRYEVEPAAPARADAKVIVASALAGFSLALIGVAVGRWTARR